MTNFERLYEIHKDLLIQCIAEGICKDKNSGLVTLCAHDTLKCKDCAFSNEGSCDISLTRKWLKEEYSPYKIGQVVLVDDFIYFYNGYYNGKYYVIRDKKNINKKFDSGEPYGSTVSTSESLKEYKIE